VKMRLKTEQRGRITNEGDLLITSQEFRDQEKNRHACLEKLRAFILQATLVPKKRRKTKPSRAAKARRVAEKRHRSATRAARRPCKRCQGGGAGAVARGDNPPARVCFWQ